MQERADLLCQGLKRLREEEREDRRSKKMGKAEKCNVKVAERRGCSEDGGNTETSKKDKTREAAGR